jgi:hypothetical protein
VTAVPGLGPDEVRQRIALYLGTALGAPWAEAAYPYQLLTASARSKAHLVYAVGLGASVPVQGHGGRQVDGVLVETAVGIRYLYRLRSAAGETPEVGVSDVDAALAAEVAIVQAITRTKGRAVADPGLIIKLDRVTGRDVIADGTYWLGEVACTALHVYPG